MPLHPLQAFKTVNGLPYVKEESFLHVIAEASTSNPMNATIAALSNGNDDDVITVRNALRRFGQEKFINLSRSYPMSASALAMYAGDGIVAKVILEKELSQLNDVVYHLPSIKSLVVEGKNERFHIRFYPWVPTGDVGAKEIALFTAEIEKFGMVFNAGDNFPKNIHRLPDKAATLIGIDSDMFHASSSGVFIPAHVRSSWHAYLHALYPIYDVAEVSPQTPETVFTEKSLHNPAAGLVSFEDFMGQSGGSLRPDAHIIDF